MDKSVQKVAEKYEVFADEPWAQNKGEADESYAMFKEFRDSQPYERPTLLHILAAKYGKTPQGVKEIAFLNQWNYRASRFDLWQEGSFRKGVLSKKRTLGVRLTSLSEKILEKSEQAFEKLEADDIQPTYREAVEMARLGIELQRAGFGLSDVIAKNADDNEEGGAAQYIEAAVQISAIIRTKLKNIEVNPDDIVDGDAIEVEEIDPVGISSELSSVS